MFIGQVVTVVLQGHEKAAVIASIAGAGASGYKTLRLIDVKGEVAHENDREPGEAFWREGAPGEAKAKAVAVEAAEEAAKPPAPKAPKKKPRTISARVNRHKKK